MDIELAAIASAIKSGCGTIATAIIMAAIIRALFNE